MERLILEEPTLARKDAALEYIAEHKKYNSNINGCGALDRYEDNYEEWLLFLEEIKAGKTAFLPALTYFLVRETDDKIIGMVNIRLQLNEHLRKTGGNIGYGIRPTERRKGYNKVNLYLALKVCKEYDLEEVLLDCYDNNPGSYKTMEALGGKLVETYKDEKGNLLRKYKIDVNYSLEKYQSIYEPAVKNNLEKKFKYVII